MNPFRTLLLAVALVGVGFLVGYGYQANGARTIATTGTAPTATATPQAPLVKGLHSSPDGKLLAFTGVYRRSSRAGVWILNPATGIANGRESPAGWQDYVPSPVAEAKAGLYTAPVDRQTTSAGELQPIAQGAAPRGEKIITGLLAPSGELILKTRSEPKALYAVRDDKAVPIDRSPSTYGQNRPVRENGKLVFYVVRDVPTSQGAVALFRVAEGQARQISPFWDDVSWSYVAPSGQKLLVARQDEDSTDWDWTLYQITPTAIKQLKHAQIPGDVISVYWSPNEKRILGAAGEKLWIIDVPTLKANQLGTKTDWNADDATWIGNQDSVAIAESGEIWRVDVPSGQAVRLWRFPDSFWN
jgi:hypothetical protein